MPNPAHEMSRRRGAATRVRPLIRPSWLSVNVWPFQTFAIEVNDTQIAFTDVGRHDAPAILFVHTGTWSFIWRDVMLRLSAQFRCICFDAPGTGQSQRIAPADIRLDKAARTLTGIIEALDLDRITLVFHDLAGVSGIAGAGRVPDRVRALCAVNTFAWKPTGAAFRGMLTLMGSTVITELDARLHLLPRITSTSFGAARNFDEPSRAAYLAGIGTQGLRSFHAYMRDAAYAESIYEEADRALRGPFRSLPLVTVFGERNDPLKFQPRWKELFPHARQLVVARGNHFPMCDDPGLVANAIRGLS